ncbi:MAG TPA: DUF4426 domain-containing protein [Steroidobacteraceae bacterium]|nr:DUF4426 domain-containing protein [Steroidobacteraceae bacterium]
MPPVRCPPGWPYRRRSPLAPHARAGLLCLLACFAACGSPPPPPPPAIPYTDPGFIATGAVRLHYALTPTQDLPAEIAGSYGIVQRRNLALLTITIVPQGTPGATRLVASELSATAIALTGERKTLMLARHDGDGGPTYLATVDVRHRVPVTIELQARASADSPRISARWTRQFHLD